MGEIDLFDGVDLDIDLGGTQTEEVEPVIEKPKAKSKKTQLKEETKAVVEKHSETVEAMKAEETQAEKKTETPKDIIYIDAQNTDDRKKVIEFMKEGRIIATDKNKPFILAEQRSPLYDCSRPAIHTIMCEEIIHVTIRKYYLDLEIMPLGSRTLIREVIWVYHKGYNSQSMITKEQLKYLLANKFVKKIFYVHNDVSEGTSYFLGLDSKEPDTMKLEKMKASSIKNYNIQIGKIIVEEEKVEEPEEDINLEGIVEEIV